MTKTQDPVEAAQDALDAILEQRVDLDRRFTEAIDKLRDEMPAALLDGADVEPWLAIKQTAELLPPQLGELYRREALARRDLAAAEVAAAEPERVAVREEIRAIEARRQEINREMHGGAHSSEERRALRLEDAELEAKLKMAWERHAHLANQQETAVSRFKRASPGPPFDGVGEVVSEGWLAAVNLAAHEVTVQAAARLRAVLGS